MSINLLPWRQNKQHQKQKQLMIRLIIYFFILFFISLLLKFIFYWDAQYTQQKISTLQQTIKQITLQNTADVNTALLKKLQYFQSALQKTKQQNQSIEHMLLLIANTLPHSATLHQLVVNKNDITLSGMSDNISDIHHYITLLHAEKIGQTAQLINAQRDDKNPLDMQFTIKIAPTPNSQETIAR